MIMIAIGEILRLPRPEFEAVKKRAEIEDLLEVNGGLLDVVDVTNIVVLMSFVSGCLAS